MNVSTAWLAKPPAKESQKRKPYDVSEILLLDENRLFQRPSFQYVIRQFASSRLHSKEDLAHFVEAFESASFEEEMYNARDVKFFPLSETMRYARRAFWKLVELGRAKAAMRVAELTWIVLRIAEREVLDIYSSDKEEMKRKREKVQQRVQICYDRLALFMLERYIKRDAGHDFFKGQTFKFLIKVTLEASQGNQVQILLAILESFKKKLEPIGCYKPHVDQSMWVEMKILFLAILDLDNKSTPPSVKRHLGQLLGILAEQKFHHNEFSHREWKEHLTADEVRMKEYLASIQVVLNHTNKWLCGRTLFEDNKGLVIKPWFYGL